ncbi:MAG: TolC family protein [Bacteroidetes bacterium]|nr:MAG: TolC family protein [Bacteroidota bacterium]
MNDADTPGPAALKKIKNFNHTHMNPTRQRKRNQSILLLLLMFLPVLSAWSQQILSLEDLIDRTLQENYQLQVVRNTEQMARNNNTLGNAGFLPSVDLRGDVLQGIQNTEQRFFSGEVRSGDNARSTRQDAIIELNWTVFDGFRMFARRDRLSFLEQLSKNDTRYFIEQTLADITRMYYQLLMEIQVLETVKKSLEVSAFRLKLEEQKRSVGTGNALLYQQALIDYNSDSAMVAMRAMQVKELQIQINRITNREPGFEFSPASSAVDLTGVDTMDELVEKAIAFNLDLERAHLEEMIAETTVRIERSARYPVVSLFGNYSYSNQTNEVGFLETSTALGGQYGVRVRFNLYSGGQQNTRIRNAMVAKESSELSSMDVRSMLTSQLASLINRYESYLTQFKLLDQSLKAAESSLVIAEEQLQAGAISGFEFRQAQLTSLRVQNQKIELLFSLKSLEVDIFRLSGELMEKIIQRGL